MYQFLWTLPSDIISGSQISHDPNAQMVEVKQDTLNVGHYVFQYDGSDHYNPIISNDLPDRKSTTHDRPADSIVPHGGGRSVCQPGTSVDTDHIRINDVKVCVKMQISHYRHHITGTLTNKFHVYDYH